MRAKRGLAAAMLVALSSCTPQAANRVALQPPATSTGGAGGADGGGGIGQTGGAGQTGGGGGGSLEGGSGGSATGVIAGLDARPASTPPDGPAAAPDGSPERLPLDGPSDLPRDTAPDPTERRVVQLVVADVNQLQPGDIRLRTIVATRLPGFIIRPRDDAGPVDLADTVLVVIAGSVDSTVIGTRYRGAPIPVITCESNLFDDMGMTGTVVGTDFGEESGTEITILDVAHPLAAGLSGTVAVVSAAANRAWGNPAPLAARIASIPGAAARVAIFAYPAGAQMSMGSAPAKRIGFVAQGVGTAILTDAGIQLLGAALDWAIQPD